MTFVADRFASVACANGHVADDARYTAGLFCRNTMGFNGPMKSISLILLFAVTQTVCWSRVCSVLADEADWAEGSTVHNDGANREFYNAGAFLPWKQFMGDWRDADDVQNGDAAYAETNVADTDTRKPVRWDVTSLVKQWADGTHPNQGFLLRITDGRGPIMFASRESKDATLRPKLQLTGALGSIDLAPAADTYLTKSTYRSQGKTVELRVSAEPDHLLIRFDFSSAATIGDLSKATLVLQTTKQFGSADIGIFAAGRGITNRYRKACWGSRHDIQMIAELLMTPTWFSQPGSRRRIGRKNGRKRRRKTKSISLISMGNSRSINRYPARHCVVESPKTNLPP